MVYVVIENGVIEIIQRRRAAQKWSKRQFSERLTYLRSSAPKIDVNYVHSDHFAPQARLKMVKNDQNVSKIIEIKIIAENH